MWRLCLFGAFLVGVQGFSPSSLERRPHARRKHRRLSSTTVAGKNTKPSSYEDTDGASQGLVSSLTGLVNTFSATPDAVRKYNADASGGRPPQNIGELRDRLKLDYDENNYLWTGDLDLACFDPSCRFTDPTLSFEGTDTFVRNTQNLVPWVERLVENYQSILLDIQTTPEYVETRWNMVGELNALFWKPKIDVIGRTKFWFREESDGLRVYDYDEKWEIPAYQALLQLVTPAGTFSRTQDES